MNFHFKRNLNDREVPNLLELLYLLERVNICSYTDDRRIWLGDASVVFSCKSAFSHLIDDESIQVCPPVKIPWKIPIPRKIPIPPKVKYLLGYHWRGFLMFTRCFKGGNLIMLCLLGGLFYVEEMRNMQTIYLHCQFSLNLWPKVLGEFNLQWVVPKHCTDLLELGYSFPFCKKSRSLWNVIVMATCWSIWLERNKRIFEDSIDNVDCLWDKIKYWVAIWLFDVKDFKVV